jgi:hypothetical protein
MYATMRWGGGLLAVLLFSSVSFAQTWYSPVFRTPALPAPDACGPGFYTVNGCGAVYGPNHWVYPPFPPYQGPAPPPCFRGNGGPQGPGPAQPTTGIYPTHPYVRGPRDFFMWNEDMEDTRGRDVRPILVVP